MVLNLDDSDVFDRHYEFIQKSFLPSVSLHDQRPMNQAVGRLRGKSGDSIFKITNKVTRRIISNVIPKRMSRIELMQGFRDLYARVFSWESFSGTHD